MKSICLLDTCFLLELYKVPGFSTDTQFADVSARLKRHIQSGALLYVTTPCIIEVANHLADACNKPVARAAGLKFVEDVRSSMEKKEPWSITPTIDSQKALADGISDFIKNHFMSGVGLCDTFTVIEANRLKEKYKSLGYKVHILTLDEALKAHEPDAEPNI